jgi:hypothetical protein
VGGVTDKLDAAFDYREQGLSGVAFVEENLALGERALGPGGQHLVDFIRGQVPHQGNVGEWI